MNSQDRPKARPWQNQPNEGHSSSLKEHLPVDFSEMRERRSGYLADYWEYIVLGTMEPKIASGEVLTQLGSVTMKEAPDAPLG